MKALRQPVLQPLALATLLALTVAGPAQAGSVRFQVQELATPAGGSSMAYDVNNLGQITGWVQSGGEETRVAALWQGSQRLALPEAFARKSEGRALNDLGQVVGLVDYGNFDTRAALWSAGQVTVLPGVAGFGDRAADINNSGLIVGSVIAANGYQHAAVWRNGQLTDLGATTLQSDRISTAAGVNNWDQIVGSGTVLGNTSGLTPLTWTSDGSGPFNVHGSYGGSAINDLGQVLSTVRVGDPAEQRFTPVVLHNGQVTHMLAGGAEGWFTAISNNGQAVGTVNYSGGWLWSPSSGAVHVNGLLAPGSTGVSWLTSINDHGQMSAHTGNGRGALLTPVGHLRFTGPTGGFFNEAAHWDSGVGLAPNKFLDATIATTNGVDVIGTSYEHWAKSITVGGGAGIDTLILIEDGRLGALEGTKLLARGQLMVAAGSDASFARGTLGGDLDMFGGSAIVLKASRPQDTTFDRLTVEGAMRLHGGDLVITMVGAPPAQLGDSYDFLDWGTLDGQFSQLVLPELGHGLVWDSSRLYVDGVLSVTAVPEPQSCALLLAGLTGVGWRLRRRRA